jgi:glycosyltransferase involved in cell wall biosynthesis
MKIAINAVSAKRGGAVTYLQNVLPELLRQLGDGPRQIVVWRGDAETGDEKWPGQIDYRRDYSSRGRASANPLRRVWFDQVKLPRMLRAERAEVLFSSANYGPLLCPARQVLLVRNPIYYDETFLARMKSRKVVAYHLAQRFLTNRCIAASDVVLFPTEAMLRLVAAQFGGARANWRVAHYGTRHDLFAPALAREEGGPVRLLHVSIYSDQKNLETLLRAAQLLRRQGGRRYHLRLTAGFDQDWLGASALFPNFQREQALYRELQAAGVAEDTNWRRYGTLPDLYRSADIFVFPSYTESFGHPLVEAMASGLPIVAADVPVNRELCGDAAAYFPTFDAEACAQAVRRVAEDAGLQAGLRAAARARARLFTWERHAAQLIRAFRDACREPSPEAVGCADAG